MRREGIRREGMRREGMRREGMTLEKTQQLSLQPFGNAPAKSGILARNHHKKGPQNPGGRVKAVC